jgi:hypothetical protein
MIAGSLVVASPSVLHFFISAGGTVRTASVVVSLFALVTLHAAFRSMSRIAWSGATLLGSITVASHPITALFYLSGALGLFAQYGREKEAIKYSLGASIAAFLLTSPWWFTAVNYHGIETVLSATGTHGGLGQGPSVSILIDRVSPIYSDIFVLFTVIGVLVAAIRNDISLLIWLILTAALTTRARYVAIPTGLALASVLWLFVAPPVRRLVAGAGDFTVSNIQVAGYVLAACFLFAVVVPTVTVGTSYVQKPPEGKMVVTLDHEIVTAADWAEKNTGPRTEYVVVSDAAEWWPYLADRTTVIMPWGAEWLGQDIRSKHLRYRDRLNACRESFCFRSVVSDAGGTDYLVVPKGGFSVGTRWKRMPHHTVEQLSDSDWTTTVYQNDGVIIFRVRNT